MERIGPTIELKGEKEYKKALSGIKAEAALLGSEMKRVAAEMQNSSNAQEAATAKAEVLNRQIESQYTKIGLLNGQHDLLVGKLEKAQAALAQATAEFGSESIEAAKAQAKVDSLSSAITKNETETNKTAATIATMTAEYDGITGGAKEAADAQERYESGLKLVDDASKEAADAQKQHADALTDLDSQEKLVASEIELANSKLRSNASEHKKTRTEASNLKKEIALEKDKYKELSSALNDQKSAVDKAKSNYDQLSKTFGENSEEAQRAAEEYRKQKNALNETQAAVNSSKAKLNTLNNELKENKKGNSEAKEKAKEFAKELLNVAGSAVKATGKLVAYTAKAAGTMLAAGAAGAAALAKQAVEAYASYEQLVGGVETLFGAGGKSLQQYADSVGLTVDEASEKFQSLTAAQELVQANAREAWKTTGMSANEYMENVTSFSASLISSVGGNTEQAAAVADMAMRDMSDNWNKFGSDQQSVINAYQGFAKGQYNMLDNLKLGYGGTKSEMERLLADAEKISGVKYDINNLSDVYSALHVIQGELGVTGTTANEAASTISGSVAAMKASYQNLLVGIADDNADFDQLVNDFADSVITAVDNIAPRFATALSGIGTLITKLAPIISRELPKLVSTLLPQLVSAASALVQGVLAVLPSLISMVCQVISDNLPMLIDTVTSILEILGSSLIENAPMLISAVTDIVSQLVGFFVENSGAMLDGALALITTLCDSLLTAENITNLVNAAVELVTKFVSFLGENAPMLIETAVTLILTLITAITDPANLGKMVDAAISLIFGLVDGILAALPLIIDQAPVIVENLVTALVENAPKLLSAAVTLVEKLIEGIGTVLSHLWEAGKEIVRTIGRGIEQLWPIVKNWGKDVINKIGSGISSLWSTVKNWGKDVINKIGSGISSLWTSVTNWGKDVINKVGSGISSLWSSVKNWGKDIISKVGEGLRGAISAAVTWGKDLIQNFWNGIQSKLSWLWDGVKGIAGGIADFLGFSEPKKGPLSNFHTFAPDMMELFTKGIKENEYLITDQIQKSFDIRGLIDDTTQLATITPISAAPSNNVTKTVNLGGVKFEITARDGTSARAIADEVKGMLYDEIRNAEEVFA